MLQPPHLLHLPYGDGACLAAASAFKVTRSRYRAHWVPSAGNVSTGQIQVIVRAAASSDAAAAAAAAAFCFFHTTPSPFLLSDIHLQRQRRSWRHHVHIPPLPFTTHPLPPVSSHLRSYCNSPDFQGVSGIVGIGLPLPQVTFAIPISNSSSLRLCSSFFFLSFTSLAPSHLPAPNSLSPDPRAARSSRFNFPQLRHAASPALPAH